MSKNSSAELVPWQIDTVSFNDRPRGEFEKFIFIKAQIKIFACEIILAQHFRIFYERPEERKEDRG